MKSYFKVNPTVVQEDSWCIKDYAETLSGDKRTVITAALAKLD